LLAFGKYRKKGKHTGTPCEPTIPPNFHLPTGSQRKNAKRAAIDAKYNFLKKKYRSTL
jgi:hypothetical protein